MGKKGIENNDIIDVSDVIRSAVIGKNHSGGFRQLECVAGNRRKNKSKK